MYCSKCSHQVNESAVFCSYCGQSMKSENTNVKTKYSIRETDSVYEEMSNATISFCKEL